MTSAAQVLTPLPVGAGYATTGKILRQAAIFTIIFYPFKGLLSLPFFFLFGDQESATYVTPIVAFTMIALILLSFFANAKASQLTRLDVLLLVIGVIFFSIAVLRQDFPYAAAVMLLMVMPVFIANMAYGSGATIKRMVLIFFALMTIYISVEWVMLNTHVIGITDDILVDSDALAKYQSALIIDVDFDEQWYGVKIIDLREHVRYGTVPGLRTGGFLANVLTMASLVAMSATFFYVSYRQSRSNLLLVPLGLSIFNLATSLSTSAVLAFVVTTMFYEMYRHRKHSGIIAPAIIIISSVVLITYFDPVSFIYRRFIENVDIQLIAYTSWNPITWQALLRSVVGWHGMGPTTNYLWSTNDILNVTTAVGIVPAYLIFKRLLSPALARPATNNPDLTIYSMVVLTGVLAMIHNQAVLTINTFLIVILLNMRCHAILRWSEIASINERGTAAAAGERLHEDE